MTPITRIIKSYHNTSVKEIKSLFDYNKLWRWDMDSSDSHIFEKLWLTFRDICRQPITLLAKIKLIQKLVIAPLTKRKIIYFEKTFSAQVFCTWDWFKLKTIKERRIYCWDSGEDYGEDDYE
jgi:hypothetical protein